MTPFRLVNFSSGRTLSPGIDLSTLGQGVDLGAGGPILGGNDHHRKLRACQTSNGIEDGRKLFNCLFFYGKWKNRERLMYTVPVWLVAGRKHARDR
jgi:hypothetical protein